MSQHYLAKLEKAFLICSELGSTAQQREYLANLATTDADLARELTSILALQGEWKDILEMSGGQFCSIMFTTLGEEKKTETKNDLIDFLTLVSPSEAQDGIANLEGIELNELVGVGATGFVFKGWDTDLSRAVAVKILAPSIAKNSRHRRAFVAEARMASALKHPHVISIYHIFSDPVSCLTYFVSEWIEGFTLQQWIVDRTTHENTSFQDKWLKQLVEAVSYSHENGIVHRDLKPANVMIDQATQNVVLIDFGLAFETKHWRPSNSPKGTPLYMSPEQLRGETLGQQSDLFALSEITSLLLYDCHPFQDATIESLTQRVLFEKPSFSSKIPRPVQKVLSKALNKQAGRRHDSAGDFFSDLQRARGVDESGSGILTDSDLRNQRKTNLARGEALFTQRSMARFIIVLLLVAMPILYLWLNGNGKQGVGGESQIENASQKKSPLPKVNEKIIQDLREQNLPFTNFLGMTFEPGVMNPKIMDEWPSKGEDFTELFSKVDWRNRAESKKYYIANQLVTYDQYQQIMGKLPAKKEDVNSQDPVTGINYFEALEFARKVKELDPSGLNYGIYRTDDFAFKMYGEAFFNGQTTVEKIRSSFANAVSSQENDFSSPFPLQDTFGDIKEWTGREARLVTKQEGVVSYGNVPNIPSSDFVEVVGGFAGDLFLHLHDLNFGMNDNLVGFDNLEHFIEEDGLTSYLCPKQHGKLSTLTYRYEFDGPLKTANISDPFSLYSETSSAGIRVRASKSKDPENWEELPWVEVFNVQGLHMQSPPLRNFDLTEWVQGCSALEIQYWVESKEGKLNYTQIGRTLAVRVNPANSKNLGYRHNLPDVFRFEAWINKPADRLRSSIAVPNRFRSDNISFRLMFWVD